MLAKIWCLVLNFNRPLDTVACVKKIYQSDLPQSTQVLILDNGSENLQQFLKVNCPARATNLPAILALMTTIRY
jgi:hypothetical protein